MTVKVRFEVKTDETAKKAEIMGDFNNWGERNSKMKRVQPGLFRSDIKFKEEKKYYYKFKVDGEWKEEMNDTYPATEICQNSYGTQNYCIDISRWEEFSRSKPHDSEQLSYDYDQKAEALLRKCIAQRNFTDWREYKKQNKNINLTGIDLSGEDLESVDLSNIDFSKANLSKINFYKANLKYCRFLSTNLKKGNLVQAKMYRAQLQDANLDGARLNDAELVSVQANYASLLGANIHNTYIQNADFSFCKIDGETLINTTQIDKKTNFTGVGLLSARLKPGLFESLSYNIRKFRWEEWYNKGNIVEAALKKIICRPFWWLSDYGRSTLRIVSVFFGVAILFALLYWLNPEILHNAAEDYVCHFYRTLYFSIVTMVTLGFSNMNAAKDSFIGNSAVCFQILFGYVTLAALVTRISVLFVSGGPEIGFKRFKYKPVQKE